MNRDEIVKALQSLIDSLNSIKETLDYVIDHQLELEKGLKDTQDHVIYLYGAHGDAYDTLIKSNIETIRDIAHITKKVYKVEDKLADIEDYIYSEDDLCDCCECDHDLDVLDKCDCLEDIFKD